MSAQTALLVAQELLRHHTTGGSCDAWLCRIIELLDAACGGPGPAVSWPELRSSSWAHACPCCVCSSFRRGPGGLRRGRIAGWTPPPAQGRTHLAPVGMDGRHGPSPGRHGSSIAMVADTMEEPEVAFEMTVAPAPIPPPAFPGWQGRGRVRRQDGQGFTRPEPAVRWRSALGRADHDCSLLTTDLSKYTSH